MNPTPKRKVPQQLLIFSPGLDRDYSKSVSERFWSELRSHSVTLILDTNVLININNAYRTTERHKQLSLIGLPEIAAKIKRYAGKDLKLSVGNSLSEVPLFLREHIYFSYLSFFNDYIGDWRRLYQPAKVNTHFPLKRSEAVERSFSALPDQLKLIMAPDYSSLLYISIIQSFVSARDIEKFEFYLYLVERELDLVSAKSKSIARYAFAPELGMDDNLRTFRSLCRKNFAPTGLRDLKEIERAVLNGVFDFNLIFTGEVLQSESDITREINGVGNLYIATYDRKLHQFCKMSPPHIMHDSSKVMARALQTHEDIKKTSYWSRTLELMVASAHRRGTYRALHPDSDRALRIATNYSKLIDEGSMDSHILDHFCSVLLVN